MLKIANNLSLPTDAVTQTFGILAKRGVGKTYTASVMAEEMLKARQQVVAIDPTGAWFGLRSSADGKRAGFPIVVMGGEHGDVPLEDTAGEVIASAIVENRLSAVIDLSLFRKGQLIRFMVAFAETLYRLNRDAMHLFVDEADAVAPQGRQYGGDENRMLGAMEDIVRRGRRRGIGCTLITQRPAVLNKNVLTQCESLFSMRLVHPKDIDAVMEWVNVHADETQAKEMVDSLPTLGIGEAWFWSPGWMSVMRRVLVRERETFDSSATPKPGQTACVPKALAEIDLNALGEKIKATVEKAKANDPAALRRRIAELESKARKSGPTSAAAPDQSAIDRAVSRALAARDRDWDAKLRQAERTSAALVKRIDSARATLTLNGDAPQPIERPSVVAPSAQAQRPVHTTRPARAEREQVDDLTGPERRILDAIAWMETLGINQPELSAVAFLAGYTVGGGAFNNPRGALRTKGLIEYRGNRLALTDAGRASATVPDAPLTSDELQRRVMERLPGPEQRILKPLLDAYPNDISNEELAELAGYSDGGGAFNNPKGRLRSLGLIDYPDRGRVVALPLLFLENR